MCLLAGGCIPYGQTLPRDLPVGDGDQPATADRPAARENIPPWRRWPGSRSADTANVERRLLGKRIGEAGQEIEQPVAWRWTPPAEGAGPYRWQHAGLAEEMAFSDDARQSLATALASENPIVRHTAAIGLGRLDPGTQNEALYAVADDRLLPTSIRRAAIETLAAARDRASEPLLNRLLDKYGRPDAASSSAAQVSTYSPELHSELLGGFAARGVDPASDERFLAALSSPSELVQTAVLDLWQERAGDSGDVPPPAVFVDLLDPSHSSAVRLRALRLWSEHSAGPLPEEASRLLESHDPKIRIAAVRAAVAHHHPAALEALRQAAGQYDLSAKLQAVELLGQLGGPEAQTTLRARMQSEKERIRQAIVPALARMGDWASVFEAADDEKWQVRHAVAVALADNASSESRRTARALLADSSGEVRLAMVRSLDGWPLAAAGPLLLDAAKSTGSRGRTEAVEQLKRRWEPARDLPIHAPAGTSRDNAVAQLHRVWAKQFGPIEEASLDTAGEAEAETEAETEAEATASALSEGQLARIEHLLARWDPSSPNETLRESGHWKTALDEGRATRMPLPRPFVAAAIAHPSPMVRRAACEYWGSHGTAAAAPAIVPLLLDSDTMVVRSAIAALGLIGSADQIEPLKNLLGHSDKQLRAAAAGALARLGSPSGPAALERLALDRDKAIRRAAALEMGRLEDRTFTATLIRLLDDERPVQTAAVEALVAVVGRDVAVEPGAPTPGVDEKSRRWKAWHRQ